MKRRLPKPLQPTTTAPQGVPDPTMPSDIKTRHVQLRLSRLQCAYLHRELATALKQAPLAPTSFDSDVDVLRAENVDLRERLTILTRHYEDLQNRYKILEQTSNRQQKEFDNLLRRICGEKQGAFQSTLADEPVDLAHVLTNLLKLAHPDKWQTQPATALAHEIAVTVNGLRERLGVQA
jgi:molecular chaperone GrpE (heat shock protein)